MADRCYWTYHFRWALCHIRITIFFILNDKMMCDNKMKTIDKVLIS